MGLEGMEGWAIRAGDTAKPRHFQTGHFLPGPDVMKKPRRGALNIRRELLDMAKHYYGVQSADGSSAFLKGRLGGQRLRFAVLRLLAIDEIEIARVDQAVENEPKHKHRIATMPCVHEHYQTSHDAQIPK